MPDPPRIRQFLSGDGIPSPGPQGLQLLAGDAEAPRGGPLRLKLEVLSRVPVRRVDQLPAGDYGPFL